MRCDADATVFCHVHHVVLWAFTRSRLGDLRVATTEAGLSSYLPTALGGHGHVYPHRGVAVRPCGFY